MKTSEFLEKIKGLLQDDAHILSEPELRIFLGQALKTYSKFRPLVSASDISGDGSATYSLPAAFLDGFSQIKTIEYPQGEQIPAMIALDETIIYRTPSTIQLRFLVISPATGKTIRLVFSAQHVVNVSSSTVPTSDEDAVSALSASIGCQALATNYAQTQDSTISADTVSYKTKSAEYSALSNRLRAMFNDLLGLKEGDSLVAATGSSDWDTTYQYGGDRLLHPSSQR